ncbi:PAS domain S-box protein [Halorientalis regularis]|uniref:histidine kinase n=1 Tax=Halorientalis regularis TaxID=660518 RepID=A0A1G7M9Y9_9EURY|nr:PAS domain S-box protein [Halorientalis regularis]SDF58049.1 PAS domain S-box-containing protein [Halorientalis regularis]
MKTRYAFFLVLLFVTAVLSGAIFVGFQEYKATLYEESREDTTQTAVHVGSELASEFSGRRQTVRLVAATPAVTRHGTDAQRATLQRLVDETQFSGASVVASNGTMTNIVSDLTPAERAELIGADFSDRTYFQRAMAGETYLGEPITAESGNDIVTVSTPIRHNGTIVGTLNGAYHVPETWFADGVTASLGREDGLTIYARSGKEVYSEPPEPGANIIVRNATIGDTGWTVSIQSSQRHVQSTIQTVTYLQTGSILAVVFTIVGFGWWVYRRNLHQVEHLLDGFTRLENREYGTDIDVQGGEEWQQIEAGFNEMSRSLARFEHERREREQSLREFKRAVEHAGYAVFITDTEGRIEYVNPAFEEITGYPAAEAVGATPDILNSGEMSEDYFARQWETLLAGEEWDEEIVNERRSGTRYVARQTITPLTGEDGSVEKFVAIQTDITALKDRERHLQTLSRVLRHNLRNKIGVVVGSAELLVGDGDAGVDEAVIGNRIVDASQQLTDLAEKERRIVTLLTSDPRRKRIDLAATVESVATRVRHEHPDSRITVTCPDDVTVTGIDELQRGLYELVENSVVHADDRATVEVTVDPCDRSVAVTVEDDGPGIPSNEQPILTGGADIEPLSHGSGLGLWLVYHIVRLSDGVVTYADGTPTGSVVTVELPRADPRSERDEDSQNR